MLWMSEVVAFVMKIILRRQFIFFFFWYRLSRWLLTMRRPVLLAEMPKPLKQRKEMRIKHLKKDITSQLMNCTQKPWG